MRSPDPVQVGDRVLILRPFYVAGKVGVVCGRESPSDGQPTSRWLIEVDVENIVVSLKRQEFEVINPPSE
ncbi:MAG: hypothetical protein RMX96_29530 [Nostoc sp. ChiSLP02]|nr:hypothetical protein [Nostoc sp. DedSLP05]MDZ8101054.1 hypothetical protein [Nostoc sp. DedSLP01]MDZ8188982.1 hypothetical protein [Nostoc sp. ChiSLP02]